MSLGLSPSAHWLVLLFPTAWRCSPKIRGLRAIGNHEGHKSLARPVSVFMPAHNVLLSDLTTWDAPTLAKLHDVHYPALYRYVFMRLGDDALAHDIASEAFLRLMDAIQAKKPPHTNVRGWLFGTATHIIGDYVRRAPREQARLDEDFGADFSTELQAEERLLFATIRAAMHYLTPEQEQVLLLRFGNGYSLEESAQLMGKTVNAVKVLQFRAMQALRERIQPTHAERID